MKIILFVIGLLFFFSCRKDASPYAQKRDAIFETLDNLEYGCRDTVVKYYFKGTLNNKPICYGNYTNNPQSGDFYAFDQVLNLSSNSSSSLKGSFIQFGFEKNKDVSKEQVVQSFIVETPLFKFDSAKIIGSVFDSLIPLGNLPIRTIRQGDTWENYEIAIELEIRKAILDSKTIITRLSTANGLSKPNNFLKCKEKIKLSKTLFMVRFELNCELYCNIESKYFGNLTGELVTIIELY